MFGDTVLQFIEGAAAKAKLLRSNPLGYFLSSMLAGIYVGFGIVLIFAIGGPLAGTESPVLKLVMGASFGIALSLVIFAGSELFTGNAMVMSFGLLGKSIQGRDLAGVWALSWFGNLCGALLLAAVAVGSGAIHSALPFFAKVAAAKMNAGAGELVLRGILCNTLVCLAVWTATRAKSESAKLIMIWWCLFGFIGSGYEHSIANMSLLAVALFGASEAPGISWAGYAWNLGWVTLGNIIAAVVVLALPYWIISRNKAKAAVVIAAKPVEV